MRKQMAVSDAGWMRDGSPFIVAGIVLLVLVAFNGEEMVQRPSQIKLYLL
jgi:hypothetical protein